MPRKAGSHNATTSRGSRESKARLLKAESVESHYQELLGQQDALLDWRDAELSARDAEIAKLKRQLESAKRGSLVGSEVSEHEDWPPWEQEAGEDHHLGKQQGAEEDQVPVAPELSDLPVSQQCDLPSAEKEPEADIPEGKCVECGLYMVIALDSSDDALGNRSRLNDCWYDKHCGSCGNLGVYCTVPFSTQVRLLQQALRLAQQTLWCALRRHWPEAQAEYYPESFEQVRFGRQELEYAFGSTQFSRYTAQLGCRARNNIMWDIRNLVGLRNAVSHPYRTSNEDVDMHIQRAQKLAIAVGDEPRAMKLRRLRDELHEALDLSLAEIEAYEPFAALPYARPWALHHQVLLHDYEPPFCSIDTKTPACIQRAAREWRAKGCRPGEMTPELAREIKSARDQLHRNGQLLWEDGQAYKDLVEAYKANNKLRDRETWAWWLEETGSLREFFGDRP
ncbi:hypothetical protein LTR53_006369 [Teratosphaeriaceae sp. CCFEE 6253]|nr:hypothetical protein LTR53_006369 [Teratosphaeriaceae sp. CCFEE 6253]